MWNREYFKNRYDTRLAEAVEKLGGKCVRCNSEEELEFDHIDPITKIAPISRMTRLSSKKFWEEVGKCQLLCYTCHRDKTSKEQSIERRQETKHGTLFAYQSRGCRCELCKAAKAAYRKRESTRLDEGATC